MTDTPSLTIPEALQELGVSPGLLGHEERRSLDEQGYLEIPQVLGPEQIAELNRRLELLAALEGDEGGKEVHQEAGAARLSNLVDKGSAFRGCFTHPKVLAAIAHVLEYDLQLSSLNARAALPGQGLQAMHVDWDTRVEPGDYQVCNSIWLLDDFTPENGATRAVPGSHRYAEVPADAMPDPRAPHPDEQLLLAPAGTVFVFNSHTWHGGTLNRTDKPRRALHSYFCRRGQPQQLNQREYLSPAVIRALSPAERWLVGVE
jgi:ectoine hydroxylase-related dioxygenase (phytanoyl-CoA dioxygenase family)